MVTILMPLPSSNMVLISFAIFSASSVPLGRFRSSLASPSPSAAPQKSSLVRRHDNEDSSSEVSGIRFSSAGELIQTASSPSPPSPVSNDPCNRVYKLGTAGSKDCPTGTVAISHPEDCSRAAALVKKADGTSAGLVAANADPTKGTANFTIEDGWQNPRAFPKNCMVLNGLVYYNPTEPTPTTYEGQALCEEAKYPSGKGNTASGSACPSGYEAISTYNECKTAFGCTSGYSGCEMPDFENAAQHSSATEPKGCFREPNGCFNFNWATTEGSSFSPTTEMLNANGGKGKLHTVCKES